MVKICSIDGCVGIVQCRKLCTNHYDKLIRWGDPLQILNSKESTLKQSKHHNTPKIKKVLQDIPKQTMKNMFSQMEDNNFTNNDTSFVDASMKKMFSECYGAQTTICFDQKV